MQFLLTRLELPLFHIMTARVTFGNINGVDGAATHVTLHDAPKDQVTTVYRTASATGAADGLNCHHHLNQRKSSVDPTGKYYKNFNGVWLLFKKIV